MNIIHPDDLDKESREAYISTSKEIGKQMFNFEKISNRKVNAAHVCARSEDTIHIGYTEESYDDAITFAISKENQKKIKEWYDSLLPEIHQKLKEIFKDRYDSLTMNGKRPYYGSIGGPVLIYSFGETGLGTVITVQETLTGKKLDLSDYDNW